MPYLVLDLDKTTFVVCSDKQEIHVNHELSPNILKGELTLGQNTVLRDLQIINLEDLSKLIDAACTDYDGIIILTSGFWTRDILAVIEPQLNISPQSRVKLKQSYFHSPTTDAELFHFDPMIVYKMDKNIRLNRIIATNPALNGKHFVVLDDNSRQVRSFASEPHVKAVLATTAKPEKLFYQQAILTLAQAKEEEKLKLEGRTTVDAEENVPNQRFFKRRRVEDEEYDAALLLLAFQGTTSNN